MNKQLDHFDLQELAGLVCGMTDEESDAVINDDEDFDTPLLEKLGVDFEQFSQVASALMNNLNLGFSPMTERIHLGASRKDMWVGPKIDMTSDFLQIVDQKFPVNTSQNITINGVATHRIMSVDMKKKITVNGKDFS